MKREPEISRAEYEKMELIEAEDLDAVDLFEIFMAFMWFALVVLAYAVSKKKRLK